MNTRIEMETSNTNYFVSVKTDDMDLFEKVRATIYGVNKNDSGFTSTKRIGDVVMIKMADESEREFLIVDHDDDGYLLYSVDCIGTHCMNKKDTTDGGYDASEMRRYLNEELIKEFSEEVRNKMVPTNSNGDLIRLATKREIFGDNNGDGQWKPMERRRNRIAMDENDDSEWYWLQDVCSSISFAFVTDGGFADAHDSSYAYGVRPAIRIENL